MLYEIRFHSWTSSSTILIMPWTSLRQWPQPSPTLYLHPFVRMWTQENYVSFNRQVTLVYRKFIYPRCSILFIFLSSRAVFVSFTYSVYLLSFHISTFGHLSFVQIVIFHADRCWCCCFRWISPISVTAQTPRGMQEVWNEDFIGTILVYWILGIRVIALFSKRFLCRKI